MKRFSYVCIAMVLGLGACAQPIQKLPGRIVDASIVIEADKTVMIDWIGAGKIAVDNGYPVEPIPQSSPKPSPAEIAASNAILERNRAYTEYVRRPEVLRQAQEQVRPDLERWLTETPNAPFFASGRSYPALNSDFGQDLRLVLKPRGAIVSPRSTAQMSSVQATASVLATGLANGRRSLMRFVGEYEIVFADTGNRLKSGSIRPKFTSDGPPSFSDPYQHVFAMMIWDAIARDGGTTTTAATPVRQTPQRTERTQTPPPTPIEPVTPSTPSVAEPAFPPVPGSPPLFEGTSYALFTPQHLAAYCGQKWRTRSTVDGRTEYNPCTERSAFAP